MEASVPGNRRRLQRFTAIDLFSGCGGLTLGLRRAGFDVIQAIDNDDLVVATYRRNHPGVPVLHCDIRTVSGRSLAKRLGLNRGELDLLAGCPPCQGFSSMRTRNRGRVVRDPRNKDLIAHFLRFVRALLPKAVMMENVPGLLQDRRLRLLNHDLRALGYRVHHGVLDAADFGIPQRRRRLMVLASRVGEIAFAKPLRVRRVVRDAIGMLSRPGRSGDALHDFPEIRSDRIWNLISRIPRGGGSRGALQEADQLECHRRCDGFSDVYGRMHWDKVAPTITGGCINPSKGRFLHPAQDRAITLREAAMLQGFPKSYQFSLERGKYAAAVMIGNAFPPGFVRPHAAQVRRLLAALDD